MAIDVDNRKMRFPRMFTELGGTYPVNAEGYHTLKSIEGYRGPRLASQGHECTQVTRSVVPQSVHARWLDYLGHTYESTGIAPISVGAVSGAQCHVAQEITVNADPDELVDLINQMMGDIPTAVSIPNMIIEIPQTLALWSALSGPIKQFLKRGKKSTMREALRANANTSLATSFGALPLVADIKALWNLSASIRAARARALAVPMSWTKQRKSVSSVAKYSCYVGSPNPDSGIAIRPDPCTRNMWLTYKTKRNFVEDQYTSAVIAANLTGWRRPLEVLWEATPFSFVVDWFLPTGAILQQLNRGSFYGSMSVTDVWTHSRATGTATIALDNEPANFMRPAQLQGNYVVWGRAAMKIYTRSSGLPSLVPMANWPNVRQSYLGLQLVLQKIL